LPDTAPSTGIVVGQAENDRGRGGKNPSTAPHLTIVDAFPGSQISVRGRVALLGDNVAPDQQPIQNGLVGGGGMYFQGLAGQYSNPLLPGCSSQKNCASATAVVTA
jgi:hypothetical protein